METLTRFDVAEFQGRLLVIVESHLLPPHEAVVIIPLLSDYPPIRYLNPVIRYRERSFVLATRQITAVRRSALRYDGSVADQGDTITRAVDFLMAGT